MKPIIGITACSRIDDYLESVKKAGGEPRVLDNSEDPAVVLPQIDGLLLTGGLDVDPALYGETPHATTEIAPERDRFEIPLSRAAMQANLPIFAICRGVQVLNVAAGGSLMQDIPTAISSDIAHAIDMPKDHCAHPIRVAPGTMLAEAIGPAADLETCPVNSRHHQSVGRVAPNFVTSAISPDGIVEAIEKPDAAFCLGVQWHPENFWRTGEFDGLFSRFVEAARARVTR